MENHHRYKTEPVAGEYTILIHSSDIPEGEGFINVIYLPAGWTCRGKSVNVKGEYIEYKFTLIPTNNQISNDPPDGLYNEAQPEASDHVAGRCAVATGSADSAKDAIINIVQHWFNCGAMVKIPGGCTIRATDAKNGF